MTAPLATAGLGRRARRGWALRDCTLELPPRAVVGLAGPNGAGKSTLLELAVGLQRATEGTISVFGRDPRADASAIAEVGYVPQGAPLYRSFTVGEMVEFGRLTNRRWDGALVRELVARLDPRAKVSALSPGERARLALALALGKRPALLLLDEPFARLDPLAGREFLGLLMDGVAETECTVVVASHVVSDIERVCDHIVLLCGGHVRLEGNVEQLLATHRLLTGARRPLGAIRGVSDVVRERHSGRQLTLLARTDGAVNDPSWSVEEIGLEELLLGYMATERLPAPAAAQPSPAARRLRWHG